MDKGLVKPCTVVVGHYGGGKTNFAVNLALAAKRESPETPVRIADLDTVNPYFRTADAEKLLASRGVIPLLPEFAGSNVDIPMVPSALRAAARDPAGFTVVDVGGDDGAAVALMLMILKDKSLPHPALECVFTTDEETGMYGAAALDCSDLKARLLINLDNEIENSFVVACAGGARFEADVPVTRHKVTLPAYKLTVMTEKGGHSGMFIHKNRPNANLVLAKWLGYLNNEGVNFSLVSMDGGMMDNAIPMASSAVIMTDLEIDFLLFQEIFDEMFRDSDDHPHLSVEALGKKTLRAIGAEDKFNLLNALCTLPNGVQAFMEDMPDLVKTSLNFGILKTQDDRILCRSSVRSSDEGEKEALLKKLKELYEAIPGTTTLVVGNYPGWAYVRDSALRKRMIEIYDRDYAPESGRKAHAEAIHAGLECGLLLSKMPGLDIVSIGPDMEDIHTPKERLNVRSAARFCRFVLQVLREMKD